MPGIMWRTIIALTFIAGLGVTGIIKATIRLYIGYANTFQEIFIDTE